MDAHKRNGLCLLLLILVAVVVTYANHFYNTFHFDDFHSIVNNSYIRNLHHIPEYFVNPKMFSTDPTKWGLRPLVTASLAVDYWLGSGLNPFYFQLSTFIWYLVLCISVYFIYRTIFARSSSQLRPEYPALIATALYALHKANAETINYIIARTDVLSTTCIALSFLIFIAWPARRKYLFYVVPALVGVFAKETVPVLIIILFFYVVLFEKNLSLAGLFRIRNCKAVLRTVWQLLPLIIVVGVAQVYTLSRISTIPGISNPPMYYMLTQSFVWVRYVITFFLPMNLSADTDWTVIVNEFDERIIIGLCFIVVLIVFMFKTSGKAETKPVAFGLIWFSAALLPTSLAPFAEVTNDHRMFFPFIGLALSVVCYFNVLLRRYKPQGSPKYTYYALAASVLVIVLNAQGAYSRNKVWRTEESLWYDVTVKSPQNARGMMNYGVAKMAQGSYHVANSYFEAAKSISPGYGLIYLNLGVLQNALHHPEQAEANFKEAILLTPGDFQSYKFYASFLVKNNRMADAKAIAEKALTINPTSVETLQLLMNIYSELKLWQQLKDAARQTLIILPDNAVAKSYLQVANQKMST